MKFLFLSTLASVSPKVAVVHASHFHEARAAALPTIHHGDPIAIPEGGGTTSVVSGVEHDHKFNSLKGVVLRDESSNTRALEIDEFQTPATPTPFIVVGNFNSPNQLLDYGGANGGFSSDLTLSGGPQRTRSVAVVDVDGDGDMDIIIGNLNTPNQLLTNDGNGGFADTALPGGTMQTYSVAVGDVDGDGDMDIIIGNTNTPNQLLTNDGNGGFADTILPGNAMTTRSVVVVDVDGDGDMDIVIGNWDQDNQLLTNDGNGGFTASTLLGGTMNTLSVAVGDVDGDGDMDIVIGNYIEENQLLTNDGNGGFNVTALPGGALGTFSVAVGDVDGDGDTMDIVIGNHGQENQLLTNDGSGAFIVTALPGEAMITASVAVGDVDGDGDMDIVIGNENQVNQLLTNDGGGVFTVTTLPGEDANTISVAVFDPTPGPWKVDFRDMLANFTMTSDDEITVKYNVGHGRTVKTFLYQKGCTSNITMQINTTTTEQQYNSTFDILTVSHSIDKSLIANNTEIWNSTSNNLEVCQVVELREEGIGEEDMVIITNEHELLINFNLVVDYNTGNITLVQADTLEESTITNVNDYISAFKCDGEQFAASTTPHLENTVLNICIESESTDVVIDKVKTMIITQVVDGAGSDKTVTIITEDDTVYKGLTSKTPVAGKGVFVTTYVPESIFSYSGNPITVSGEVELLLANGRKLKVNIDSLIDDAGKDRSLQVDGAEQAAFFDIDVALEPQAVEDGINSATSTTGMKVFAGLVFALIYSMW